MTETDPEKRLIGYACISTYGRMLDTQLSRAHLRRRRRSGIGRLTDPSGRSALAAGRLFMPLSGHSLHVNRSDQVGGIRPFPDLLGLLCRQCKDGHLLMKPDHLTLRLLWVPNSSKRDRAVDADAQLGSLTISPRAAQDWSKATRDRDSGEARQVPATNRASISRGETCGEAPNISYRRCGVRGGGCVDAVSDYGRRPAGAVELSAR